jgi:hypothetical protein
MPNTETNLSLIFRTVVHEAGHCVALFTCGVTPGFVGWDENGGCTMGPSPATAAEKLVVAAAGTAAVELFGHEPLAYPCELVCDWLGILPPQPNHNEGDEAAAAEICGGLDVANRWKEALTTARELLLAHKPVVLAIASELLQYRKLEQREISRIWREHTGNLQAATPPEG